MTAVKDLEVMQGDFAYDLDWCAKEYAALAHEQVGLKIGKLEYGEVSPDGSAIIGEDGFIFIKGGSNDWDSQIAGNAIISDDDFTRSRENLAEFKRHCGNRGISAGVIVIPEKDVIYPELSPNCKGVTLDKRSVNIFLNDFGDIGYPLSEMVNLKEHVRVYHKRDSHFNAFGGFVVANECLRLIGYDELSYDEVPFIHSDFQDDLAVKWERFDTKRRTVRPSYKESVLANGNPVNGLHLRLDSHVIKNKKKIIIYGDSYSWNPDAGLCRYMTYKFETVHFIWSRRVDWDLLDAINPDVVIMESAERFLIGGLVRRL